MSKKHEPTGPARAAKKNLTVKLIGVGGAAHNLISQLGAHGLGEVPVALFNTEASALAGEQFLLAAAELRGLDVADAGKCRAVLNGHEEKLRAWCQGADVIFVVAGLGGKAGSGLGPVIARMAKETGALVLGFAATPFDCEGNRRQRQAQQGLERFRAAADGVICLPNENILRLIDENTSLLDTFKISNDLLADGMRGVWQLLNYNGLIEIHFEDLCAMLRDGHAECLFATAEATGPNRARDLVEKLLAHPLFDGGRALADTATALVSLVGGTSLTMAEVNRVMEKINRHCDGAQVLMGAAVDEAFADRLAITAIITRRETPTADHLPATMTPEATSPPPSGGLHGHLLHQHETVRPGTRHIPPPPALPPEKMEEIATRRGTGRTRKGAAKMQQEQLPLEIISKGRFDKSEPTIHHGEDLDQPTYIRRGMVLN